MNDVYLIGMMFVAASIIGILLYNAVRGVRGNLTNAKIGEIYNFEYEQPLHGEPERYMAKVLEIHRLSNENIQRLNARSNYRRHDASFQRTSHLVTAQTFDGKIRNFYAERTRNVRRPLLGSVLFKTGLASLLF